MSDEPDDQTIKKVMQELGRRGGKKGGLSQSTKKQKAARKSLEKARAALAEKRKKK